MRDTDEAEEARALLDLARGAGLLASGVERMWIGLKLQRGQCVRGGEHLRGFQWVTTENTGEFASWGHEPQVTCIEDRCVSVRASGTESSRTEWSDGSCKERWFYACRFQFKGMCPPLKLAGPGEVKYTLPFSTALLNTDSLARVLPHGTLAEISCTSTGHSYTAFCTEKAEVFTWNLQGPLCALDKRKCAHQNGGCSHVCSEDESGAVQCACKDGYYLGEDMFTCKPRDLCQTASCEHYCAMVGTSFECTCKDGFQLARDGLACVDVNECAGDICRNAQCRNTPGSYECTCKPGFKMNTRGVCEDIEECTQSVCGRYGKCLNSLGSFSCYCPGGFRERSSGKDWDCVDEDECINKPCEDICTNTVGSYLCSCRENFRLADNGISCVQVKEPIPTTKEVFREGQKTRATTTAPPLFTSVSSSSSNTEAERVEPLASMWVLVWVLGCVVPLLLLVALTSVVAVLRWNRSRKAAKKKSASADSYCWVSSGLQTQPDTEAR
ncbi:complement component C1q receptor [Hoplias malabaricus]|uniref:complement component C1q receptor n=1 Tax=Hoplias malabaricus TaxID=27720 RepID=UPI0034619B97